MAEISAPENPDDMFCHAVYTAWHVINRAYQKHLGRLGLTYPQYITLIYLWDQDARSVGEIAGFLDMDTSTLTPLLKRLERLGHVSRTRDPKDERRVIVSLTTSGNKLRTEAPAVTACMIKDTGLSEDQLTDLVRTLGKLRIGLKP
ncbi:MarR family winged helix-turn-helix transcriptional regulator [Roseobacter sp. EG26]|uniref:MarR family winged helix-turn-helix transcriptional regulator n=1 Tax=Roseobacter sp. EG26 TaxID=3412477 RepID=UPI003CE4E75D